MKKILLLFISCLCAAWHLPVAASVEDCNWQHIYIFGKELLGEKNSYKKFYYLYLYGGEPCTPGNERNIELWQSRYPALRDADAFHRLIYNASEEQLVQLYAAAQGRGRNPLPANPLAVEMLARKDLRALQYLVFAKQCEPLVMQSLSGEDWNQEESGPDPAQIAKLMDAGQQYYQQEKDAFIRERYALQLVRLAFASGNYAQSIALANQLTRQMPRGYVYYRILIHKAFALSKAGKAPEANLLLLEVIEAEASLRCIAFKNLSFVYYPFESYEEDEQAAKKRQNNQLKSTPFWGYSPALWRGFLLSESISEVSPTAYPFNVDEFSTAFHNRKMAFVVSYCVPYWGMYFYEKAALLSQDRELAARALFCARVAASHRLASYWEKGIQFNEDRFLKELTAKYSDTGAYRELLQQCPELADFASK